MSWLAVPRRLIAPLSEFRLVTPAVDELVLLVVLNPQVVEFWVQMIPPLGGRV